MIEWKEFKEKFITEDADGTLHINNSTAVNDLWSYIINGYYDAMIKSRIEENQRWLNHLDRFGSPVPLSLKKVTKSDLKDRIEELTVPQVHHPFCNFQSGLVRDCKYCQKAFKEYPVENMTTEELVKKYFPDVISRG